jgi:hypothetical protein
LIWLNAHWPHDSDNVRAAVTIVANLSKRRKDMHKLVLSKSSPGNKSIAARAAYVSLPPDRHVAAPEKISPASEIT